MIFNNNKAVRRDSVRLAGRVNLGATGAVSSQTKKKLSGFTVARTGVGIYTITLDRVAARWSALLAITINVIGANATYTSTAGREFFITSDLTSTTGVITFKLLRTDTGAVAEAEDNAKLLIGMDVTTSLEEQA